MKKIVTMFPGQASQFVGMGKAWFERYVEVEQRFAEASEVLGYDLKKLCLEGPAIELNRTENTQPALVALSVSMYEAIQKEHNIKPAYLLGHSVGELSALTVSGVFSFKDAIRIARIRGEAMSSCDAGAGAGMSAVRDIQAEHVEALLQQIDPNSEDVQIANYNSPTQTVIAGNAKGLKLAGERLEALGAKVIKLNVSGPFHSRFMIAAEERLAAVLKEVKMGQLTIPVMCGQAGRLYTDEDNIAQMLVSHLTAPVRWTEMVKQLSSLGVKQWLEIGPKQVLKRLTLETLPEADIFALDELDDYSAWTKLEQKDLTMPNFIGLCMGAAVATRNTNWNEAAYQKGVVESYKKLQQLHEKVASEKRLPNGEEINQALVLLNTIFETKGTPIEERQLRISSIVENTGADKRLLLSTASLEVS